MGVGGKKYRLKFPCCCSTLGEKGGLQGKKQGAIARPLLNSANACLMYRTFGADKLRPRRACFLPQRQVKVITFFWFPNKISTFVYVPAIQSYFSLREKVALAGKGQAPLIPKFFSLHSKNLKWHTD